MFSIATGLLCVQISSLAIIRFIDDSILFPLIVSQEEIAKKALE